MSFNVSVLTAADFPRHQDKPLVDVAVEAILDKKGRDIRILDMRHLDHRVADFFIICTGKTDVQTVAIADDVLRKGRELVDERPTHKEGYQRGEWILLDYGDVVIHIFQPRVREFYNLEDFWGDAYITEVESPD